MGEACSTAKPGPPESLGAGGRPPCPEGSGAGALWPSRDRPSPAADHQARQHAGEPGGVAGCRNRRLGGCHPCPLPWIEDTRLSSSAGGHSGLSGPCLPLTAPVPRPALRPRRPPLHPPLSSKSSLLGLPRSQLLGAPPSPLVSPPPPGPAPPAPLTSVGSWSPLSTMLGLSVPPPTPH